MAARDRAALLIVDMQNDFLATGGYYDEKEWRTRATQGKLSPSDIDDLAQIYLHPPLRWKLRDRYDDFVRTVSEVAAIALHSGMTTIFVQATYNRVAAYRPPLFLQHPQRRDYACHPGSWGADFVTPIQTLITHDHAKVITKHTFDAFFETELRGFLRFKQIDTVYLAGVETNVCVLFTACSALSNGFTTIILTDCVTTSRMDVHEQALHIIEIAQGRLMSKQDFLARLTSA